MTNKLTILVVEDEEDLRDIIIYNLNREGYQVVGVETGEQGLGTSDQPAGTSDQGCHCVTAARAASG